MDLDSLKLALNRSIFGKLLEEIKDCTVKKKLLELCAGPGSNIPLWFEFGFVL